jgi:hypothetical protein
MTISTAGPDVSAKKASGGDKPPTMSMKLPTDVIASARVVAALRGETITDVVAGILRPALAKMEREELAKRAGAIDAAKKGRGPK